MRIRRWVVWGMFLLGVFPLGTVRAASYFVAGNGNDLASGTADHPWRTLQHAADGVNPGDIVRISAGSYAGFDLQRSGIAGSPIRFTADAGVVINSPNARTPDGINLESTSYVIVEGFHIIGMPRAGIRIVGESDSPSQFVTVRNNQADDNGRWGIFSGYAQDLVLDSNVTSRSHLEHGIYVSNSADRPIIRHNTAWGNAGSGIQINADGTLPGDGIIRNALVTGNVVFDNGIRGGSAINLDGVQDSRIENNLLYNNHATGIALFQIDGAQGSSHNQIINNTVLNAADGRWAITISNASTDNTLYNNILFSQHTFRGGLDVDSSSLPGLISNFNSTEDRFGLNGGDQVLSLSEWQSLTGQDQLSVLGTPQNWFVNANANDYRLSSASPARDRGTLLLAPSVDIAGNVRPMCGKVDMGAWEYAISSSDLNQDCSVDASDAAVLFANWGKSGPGDLNADQVIDAADAGLLFEAWTGDTVPRAVPEPHPSHVSWVYLLFGTLSLHAVNRQRISIRPFERLN